MKTYMVYVSCKDLVNKCWSTNALTPAEAIETILEQLDQQQQDRVTKIMVEEVTE